MSREGTSKERPFDSLRASEFPFVSFVVVHIRRKPSNKTASLRGGSWEGEATRNGKKTIPMRPTTHERLHN